ncbi:MAG: spore germination protein GerW family protein [Oscillospiraceae bacterium]
MESVKNILKVDTVVGDPIYTPDGITLVPISKISVGFGGGGVELTPRRPTAATLRRRQRDRR